MPALCESWEAGDGGRSVRADAARRRPLPGRAPARTAETSRPRSSAPSAGRSESCRPPPSPRFGRAGIPRRNGRRGRRARGPIGAGARDPPGRAAADLPGPALPPADRRGHGWRRPGTASPTARSAPGRSAWPPASRSASSSSVTRTTGRGEARPLDAIEFRAGLKAAAIAAGLRSARVRRRRATCCPRTSRTSCATRASAAGCVEAPQGEHLLRALQLPLADPSREPRRAPRPLGGRCSTQDLVWRTLGRFAQPAVGLIPPGMLGHDPGRR